MLNDQPLNIPNLCSPKPDTLACGLPSEQDLQAAADKGVKTVINLCPTEETPPMEPGLVTQLGMQYFNIPIRSAQDLTREAAGQLAEIMDNCDHHPVLIHCRSANRVGALLALQAYWYEGKSAQEALQLGRNAGMTKLEPAVEQIMRQQPA
ncbi:MAG: sulfur transferase domain-containing protein [Pseudomonadota bacterium]|nr:hypothetical protein [Pseudomonadales bacterium]MDY6919125.1 sulfur transferase domain-containing protein [Pseudomonadota bacterium]